MNSGVRPATTPAMWQASGIDRLFALFASPPLVGRIRDHVTGDCHRNAKRRDMAVAPQHDRQAFTAMVVPEAARICVTAVGGPVPIALNDFIDWVTINDGSF